MHVLDFIFFLFCLWSIENEKLFLLHDMDVSSILVRNKKSQNRLPELKIWVTIESDVLRMNNDEILFQNWFNGAHSAKIHISIINRLSNREVLR